MTRTAANGVTSPATMPVLVTVFFTVASSVTLEETYVATLEGMKGETSKVSLPSAVEL